jgi:hypothetical protein
VKSPLISYDWSVRFGAMDEDHEESKEWSLLHRKMGSREVYDLRGPDHVGRPACVLNHTSGLKFGGSVCHWRCYFYYISLIVQKDEDDM